MANKFKGIGASDGIALAKVYIFKQPTIEIENGKVDDVEQEVKKYEKAIAKTMEQLKKIEKVAEAKVGEEKAFIFEAHIGLADDIEIKNSVISKIKSTKLNAAYLIDKTYEEYAQLFRSCGDAYLKERASDLKDVKRRLIANYANKELPDLSLIDQEVIVVCEDLSPSETALLNKEFVKGFITQVGGKTSHAAIMARTIGIPCVMGVKDILNVSKKAKIIALNGSSGEVELDPKDLEYWQNAIKKFDKEQKELSKYINQKTITLDGFKVLLESNIGNPYDANLTLNYGSEGVGLYRSEFLYMESTSDWPDEQTQTDGYRKALEYLKNQLVVIRTLDIGGDKKLPYFQFPHEDNPFLGYRAIRLCLDKPNIFKTQLRALLRASVGGRLAIMFPMIATVEEFKKAKEMTLEMAEQLKKEGIEVAKDVQIGMMVEIPAAVMNIEALAKYSDFFSIGTNDLIQYSMACDRMSKSVAYLYQPNNPSILRLIQRTITEANKQKK